MSEIKMRQEDMAERKYLIAILLVVFAACNLRAPITCVGSLVNMIQEDLSLTPEAAGLITTIPLLVFAALSPVAVLISDRLGAGKTLALGFAVMCAGMAVRSYMGTFGLFAGTVAVGAAIAMGNVLLPAVVKSCFADKTDTMTSLYTMIMQVVSAVATAVSVPAAIVLGWRTALFIWAVPAALAAVICMARGDLKVTPSADIGRKEKRPSMFRKRMTWWITLYMGVQSFLFYCFIAWLSPMMQDSGCSETLSGYILSGYVVMGMLGSAFLPVMMRRNRHQSATGVQIGVMYTFGMIMVMIGKIKILMLAGAMLCGFCSGLCISFSMVLFSLHTSSGEDASRISAIAQSAGYLIAAAGPVLWGKLYGMTGGFDIPLLILLFCTALLIFLGMKTGRDEIL